MNELIYVFQVANISSYNYEKHLVVMDRHIHIEYMQTMNSSPFVCMCGVTQPVVPLCKTSLSGRFMALLMDTGLLDSGATVCMSMCVFICVLCAYILLCV